MVLAQLDVVLNQLLSAILRLHSLNLVLVCILWILVEQSISVTVKTNHEHILARCGSLVRRWLSCSVLLCRFFASVSTCL